MWPATSSTTCVSMTDHSPTLPHLRPQSTAHKQWNMLLESSEHSLWQPTSTPQLAPETPETKCFAATQVPHPCHVDSTQPGNPNKTPKMSCSVATRVRGRLQVILKCSLISRYDQQTDANIFWELRSCFEILSRIFTISDIFAMDSSMWKWVSMVQTSHTRE
jgi:hypothetical protein